MAYALVQAMAGTRGTSLTLPVGATAGNLVVIGVRTSAASNPTLSDGTFTLATAAGLVEIFYKIAAGGEGVSGIAVTNGSGLMAEFSGNAASSPVDQVSSIASGSTSPLSLTNGAADATAGSLVVAYAVWSLSKAGTQTSGMTFNNGATGTRWAAAQSDDASSLSQHDSAWYGVTTGKTSADTGSATSDSMNITTGSRAVMASFKPAAAANTYTKAGFGKENG